MRRAGLRLVQFWVPDTQRPGFAAECRRQSRQAARAHDGERETLDWIDRVRDVDEWTA